MNLNITHNVGSPRFSQNSKSSLGGQTVLGVSADCSRRSSIAYRIICLLSLLTSNVSDDGLLPCSAQLHIYHKSACPPTYA